MAWRAYLVAVAADDPANPTDKTTITVKFEDVATTPTRTIMRDYTFNGGMTVTEMSNAVLADRNALRALDNLRSGLVARVGQEVT